MLTPDLKRFLTKTYSIGLLCFPSGLCHVHLLVGLRGGQREFVGIRLLKVAKDGLHFGRADFVSTADLDEIYIYESLIFGSPYINIFKFAVSTTTT